MVTDPIADIIIQIKNSYMARKKEITVSHSILKEELVRLLSRQGYVGRIEIIGEGVKKQLKIELVYPDKKPKLTDIVRMSSPGKRMYVKKDNIPSVMGGIGISIISTSSGLLTNSEARKKKIGGELLCKLW